MKKLTHISFYLLLAASAFGQNLQQMVVDENLRLKSLSIEGRPQNLGSKFPLVSFVLNDKDYLSNQLPSNFSLEVSEEKDFSPGAKSKLTFKNNSPDTVRLRNVVPFGESTDLYLTGKGDHYLSRSHLFIPGRSPVNVILPDNAWELGYSGIKVNNEMNLFGLTRRDVPSIINGVRRRFETVLYPGGSVVYYLYADTYKGEWQEGLKIAFQERYLYDLKDFDNSLFERKDLEWIRKSYVMHLVMAWDKWYYDNQNPNQDFPFKQFIERGKKLYGGDEVIGLWPTWPTLGLDQRNQFDLFRDLPGGTDGLRTMADSMRNYGTKFFICYNPWDESTRSEGHLAGLADLIRETSSDGVVLDTRGESSRELQDAADEVRSGVVMYSEGMSVPKNMPGIVSGRVHNALYYPPMLNLNKLIKPDFAIFRVAELYKERILREFNTSFFNGYGIEINQFAAGAPAWIEEQYKYLGRTSMILRENTSNFTSYDFTPLISTTHDSIWVNRWEVPNKIIYTIYSVIPEGFEGELFKVEPKSMTHFVDLWHHEELEPKKMDHGSYIVARTEAFNATDLGTNNEGAVDCIAQLPVVLKSELKNENILVTEAARGNEIRIWAGDPDYSKKPLVVDPAKTSINLTDQFGRYEGRFVIQLFEKNELLDENVINIQPGTPRLVSKTTKTEVSKKTPSNMVKIPAGKFVFKAFAGDDFIKYPVWNVDRQYDMKVFLMDKFPVTNGEFKKFLDETRYQPADTVNFLSHWKGKRIPAGQENFPVVYISYEDAKAYAGWAGKRLPSELEWQYAAQTPSLNEWPWKQASAVKRVEEVITGTLTVISIQGIDSTVCNLGNGNLYSVGSYAKGANQYGLQDLVGCVWQLTNDVYQSGSYRYIMMKGGSYYKPSSSWWYVQSGPRELTYRQYLLRVSQGFERNATVGFRCVKDIE